MSKLADDGGPPVRYPRPKAHREGAIFVLDEDAIAEAVEGLDAVIRDSEVGQVTFEIPGVMGERVDSV
jgi:hypothetical protein